MADTLVNTLYPPSVDTFQSAFKYTDPAVVNFSISSFNAASDIKFVHISITDQRNNENVLVGSKNYIESPIFTGSNNGGYGIFNGILVSSFPTAVNPQSGLIEYFSETDTYALYLPPGRKDNTILRKQSFVQLEVEEESNITINEDGTPTTDIKTFSSAYFNVGQYYKVQIRFDCVNDEEETIPRLQQKANDLTNLNDAAEATRKLANYMTSNRAYFSEWSAVTLIKPILPIEVSFPKLDDSKIRDDGTDNLLYLNRGLMRIAGHVDFNDFNAVYSGDDYVDGLWEETEHLEKYQLRICPGTSLDDGDTGKVIADSGIVYAEPNKDTNGGYTYGINHVLDISNADEDLQYVIFIDLWSNNNYHYQTSRTFVVASFASDYPTPVWHSRTEANYVNRPGYIEVNQEDGVAKIDFSWDYSQMPPGILYIKRASSKDNFKSWDIISMTKQKGQGSCSTIIEDYTICSMVRYRYAAQYEPVKGPWSSVFYSEVIYPKFYDILLQRQNRQIAVRYNGQITSLKPMVNRQKVDTLGGKYPKFVENAQMNYKQFAINGLISAEGDFNRKFLNEFDGEWYWDDRRQEYRYKYFYKANIEHYNTAFSKDGMFESNYIIRNDTLPDGEFGYTPKHAIDPDGNRRGNDGNDYIDSDNNIDYDDWGYPYNDYRTSVFVDPNDIGNANYYQHDQYLHNHWYWEREFREQLTAWLNDGEPKLLRSMPEGNVPVILTDITLTPNPQLGRRLYNFSATMYEVGDGYSLEELDKLGIIDVPKVAQSWESSAYTDNSQLPDEEDSSMIVEEIGQLWLPSVYNIDAIKGAGLDSSSSFLWDNLTIKERLEAKYRSALRHLSLDTTSFQLKEVKIQFTSKPEWYLYNGQTWVKQTQLNRSDNDALFLGYRIIINGQEILVNDRGYYQVPSSTLVSELQINDWDEDIIIDYIIQYSRSLDLSTVPSSIKTITKIMGQWGGMYPANTYIGESIYKKYEIYKYVEQDGSTTGTNLINSWDTWEFYQRLQYWNGVSLDVTPYALIGIKYQGQEEYQKLVVGRTGVLSLIDETPTDDIVFFGRKMFETDSSRQPYLDEWEYVLNDTLYGEQSETISNVHWNDLLENNIVVDNDKVIIYLGDIVFDLDDADASAQRGLGHSVFGEWLDTYSISTADIDNPTYNTVYPILIDGLTYYYIYYIDDKWYPIILNNDGTALALVPVYGYVNYTGSIVRSTY